jgi:protoheme IX farnesyltransferase
VPPLIFYTGGYLACLLGVITSISYLFAYTPLKTHYLGHVHRRDSGSRSSHDRLGCSHRFAGSTGAWPLFAILFFWQFPHFHAIS